MTELTDKLIGLIVPEDAHDFRYKLMPDNTEQLIGTVKDKEGNVGRCYLRDNPKGKIIGTITKDGEFDFDCEKYVEKYHNVVLGKEIVYKDYSRDPWYYDTPKYSFLSLIKSKGIFLEELNNQKILILERI